MYDTRIGRWLEEDPIEFEAGDPNLYRYVGNSPINFIDPSGEDGNLPTIGGLNPNTKPEVYKSTKIAFGTCGATVTKGFSSGGYHPQIAAGGSAAA
jgi:uncharacterized protein RhaS with RHS repeats